MSKVELTSDQESNAIYLQKSRFQRLMPCLQDNGAIHEGAYFAALDGYKFTQIDGGLVTAPICLEAE